MESVSGMCYMYTVKTPNFKQPSLRVFKQSAKGLVQRQAALVLVGNSKQNREY